MLPSISLVYSAELVRDGGSLAAVFQGMDGAEYVLFFRLCHQTLEPGTFERLGYARPTVIERQVGTEVQISWEHALVLINQIRPLLCQVSHVKWLDAMEATAKAEGALPDEIPRFLAATQFGGLA